MAEDLGHLPPNTGPHRRCRQRLEFNDPQSGSATQQLFERIAPALGAGESEPLCPELRFDCADFAIQFGDSLSQRLIRVLPLFDRNRLNLALRRLDFHALLTDDPGQAALPRKLRIDQRHLEDPDEQQRTGDKNERTLAQAHRIEALIGTLTITEIAGTGTYTAAAGSTLAYVRSTALPLVAANRPFTASISVGVTASDASENTGNGTITSTTQTFNGGGTGLFTAGVAALTINKPTAAVAGTALVTLDLTAEAKSWLKTRRTSATFIDDPAGRVGVGLSGAQPSNFIFRRENH